MHPLTKLLRDYEWIHMGLGIFGNTSFFVGSILFLYESVLHKVGTWLFIFGALGMLIDQIGSSIVRRERTRREQRTGQETQ